MRTIDRSALPPPCFACSSNAWHFVQLKITPASRNIHSSMFLKELVPHENPCSKRFVMPVPHATRTPDT